MGTARSRQVLTRAQSAGGITCDHLAVSVATQDVAQAAQILQALQQFVYLTAPPISIGAPTDGFPLPEVSVYRCGIAPGWARAATTGAPALYLIGRCAHGLVVGHYPAATIPLGSLLWHGTAASPEAAVAAWVQGILRHRPRVVLTEPCAPSLWRVAYQIF